jgi:ABC-2 type transport system permease protein
MQYMKLVGLSFKISILNELQYRTNFFVQIFQTALELLVALGGLGIVYSHTDDLNGWTAPELLTIVGVYFLIGGFVNMFIQPSMVRLMEDVHRGTLDFTLLKPIEAQVMVSVREVQLWKVVNVIAGVVLIAIGLTQFGAKVGVVEALAFVGMLLSGLLMVYSFWLILTTFAFWLTRIDNILVIFESMYEAGRYPIRIYPGWLQFTLTFLVPIVFAVTVPAEALLGRLTPNTLVSALGLAIFMLVVSRVFWEEGLRHYSGASA